MTRANYGTIRPMDDRGCLRLIWEMRGSARNWSGWVKHWHDHIGKTMAECRWWKSTIRAGDSSKKVFRTAVVSAIFPPQYGHCTWCIFPPCCGKTEWQHLVSAIPGKWPIEKIMLPCLLRGQRHICTTEVSFGNWGILLQTLPWCLTCWWFAWSHNSWLDH